MILKEKYFYIDSIQNLDLDYIKKTKANLIIKSFDIKENRDFYKFINRCKNRLINIFIANDTKLLHKVKSNNFYISSFNKKKYFRLKRFNPQMKIIGSAHNMREIYEKFNQGCDKIVFSRLFKTYKKGFYDVVKFNLIASQSKKKLVALGGINKLNYKKLKMVNCVGFAVLKEVKNKPDFLIR
jgi:thiamine-phosphate pyrophosphorylase